MSGKHTLIDQPSSIRNVGDCQLLLCETSLDGEQTVPVTVSSQPSPPPNTCNANKCNPPSPNDELAVDSNSIVTANTAKSSSQKVFSFSSFIRLLSFRSRRNKYKPTDSFVKNDANNQNKFKVLSDQANGPSTRVRPARQPKYHSLPNFLKSRKKPADTETSSKNDSIQSNKDKSSENRSIFSRLIRTFSFIYKRNPKTNTENFKRSKSMDNFRRHKVPNNRSFKNRSTKSSISSVATSASAPAKTVLNASTRSSNRLDRSKPLPTSITQPKSQPKPKSKTVDSVPGDRGSANVEMAKNKATVATAAPQTIPRPQHLVSTGVDTPAVCGIQNHGNTCFINSVIQCLGNTNPLAEYLVLDHFRDDLAHPGFLAKRNASRGELTENLALLLKSLWHCLYSSEISSRFKRTVSKYGDQYNGNDQHDAQEFLLWLLDKCHEDLHINSKSKNMLSTIFKDKNSKKPKKTNDWNVSDETAAMESLAQYQSTNSSSVIHDLFQGQLRSMVICRNCKYNSKTFDPYLCLSLPVPIRQTLTIFVNAIFFENSTLGMYGISIEAASTLRDLRDKISRMLKIPEKRLILLHIDSRHGMEEFANDSDMIQEFFEDSETIEALETPSIPEIESTDGDGQPNEMCQQLITIVWLNRVGIDKSGPIFGPLFTALISREISFRKLQSTILSTMAPYLIDQENVKLSANLNLRIRVLNGLNGKDYLNSDVDHPLFVPTVEEALKKTEDPRIYRGPHHLKIMVEWDLDIRHSIIVSDEQIDSIFNNKPSFIDESVQLAKECSKLNSQTTLQDCLEIYFRDESLTSENAWMCPECASPQQSVKQLSVWTLPDILIIHLKRFRYISNARRFKINTIVEYPINGLDMHKFTAQRKNGTVNENPTPPMSASTSKLTFKKRSNQNSIDETTYNLYAVCCHHGNMQGGHYTAYCKNPVDNCWYLFDDTKVSPVSEDSVNTPHAYILFYQKSSVSAAYCEQRNISTSGSSSGYLSLTNCTNLNANHWSLHMPSFNYHYNSNNVKCNTMPARRVLQSNAVKPIEKHSGSRLSRALVDSPNSFKSYTSYDDTIPRINSKKASH